MFQDFKKFILRGNFVDLAVGFTVGAGFSTVAKSFVEDILMPPIGFIMGNADFSNFFAVLKDGQQPGPYQTLEAAQAAGAITMNFGRFFNNVLSLLLVGFAMYLLILAVNRLYDEQSPKKKD
jgi:large conductance mechanosensitive channel